jgi:hypothetical protein
MRSYRLSDQYIPDELPLSQIDLRGHFRISHGPCSSLSRHDLKNIDYPLRKAARILYEKNLHPYMATGKNGASVSFWPRDLSKENARILERFRRENAPFTDIVYCDDFEVFLKDMDGLTVGDVRRFFEDFAVQTRMQPLHVPAFGMAYSIHAPELSEAFGTGINGLWEEVERCPNAYYDYRTNTMFRNYESYRMYLLGRDREQREFERDIQETEKENAVFHRLMEVTDFCRGRAGIVNQEIIRQPVL